MSSMLFSIVILLITIRSSTEVVYSCNPAVACGCSTNAAALTRIIGGENSVAASWGWAVSISLNNEDLCGGSIISDTWIITAAHCVYNNTPPQVHINAGSLYQLMGLQKPIVSRIIIHPNYVRATYENDIALIQLATPLIMTDPMVSQICIPYVSSAILSSSEWPPAGTNVVAIGWGRLAEYGPTAAVLQQVTLSTVDYRTSTCYPLIENRNVQFCAGVYGGGKDTCQGDSGGPLMMFTSTNQWVLVGITSNGIGCGRPSYSGVYTRVAAYGNWIKSVTDGHYWYLSFSSGDTLQTSLSTLMLSIWMTLSSIY